MNKPSSILVLIFSVVLMIFRVARCSSRMGTASRNFDTASSNSAQQKYMDDCQEKIDSAWAYFQPVVEALENNQNISESVLTSTTAHLYDIARDVNDIRAYDDEGDHYKKYVNGFIEHERGLTCCYLKKYQEEMKEDKKLTKATSHNLLSWMDSFESYNAIYGNMAFQLNNHHDFSRFRAAVIAASPKETAK